MIFIGENTYAIYYTGKRKAYKRTERGTDCADDPHRLGNYTHSPQFFVMTIKELPDDSIGVGGETIEKTKAAYRKQKNDA